HPASYRFQRSLQRRRICFDHDLYQILVRIRGIKCRVLKGLEKFLAWKRRVIPIAPFAWATEQHVRKRLFGQVIKLRPATAWRIFGQDGRKISGFFRKNEQLGMIVEQSHQKRGARFGLAGDKAGELLDWKI